MTEFGTGTLASISIIPLALATWLYMWGGRSGKWKRRFIASLILSTTVCVLCLIKGKFNIMQLLSYPLLIGGFSLGYGADYTPIKLMRRSVYVFGVCATGLIFANTIGGNAWNVFIVHLWVGIGSIWLGIKNPIEAATEEVFVCALLNIGLLMYPFVT